MRVLLIEENDADSAIIRQGLTASPLPIDLQVIPDGAEALAFLFRRPPHTQAEAPDIIILELYLPGKTGFEILAELEQDADLKFIPAVVLTRSEKRTDVNRCYELGANAYVVKPPDPAQFFTLVKAMIEFWHGCQFRELNDKK